MMSSADTGPDIRIRGPFSELGVVVAFMAISIGRFHWRLPAARCVSLLFYRPALSVWNSNAEPIIRPTLLEMTQWLPEMVDPESDEFIVFGRSLEDGNTGDASLG